MKKCKWIIAMCVLSFALPVAAQPTSSPKQESAWEKIAWVIAAGGAGIGLNWLAGVIGDGANQRMVKAVEKFIDSKLTPIEKQLDGLESQSNSFGQVLGEFRDTLLTIRHQQESDRVLLKSEITSVGDRLEGKIKEVDEDAKENKIALAKLEERLKELELKFNKSSH